jgi:multicomponent Na+:H+ antiporter subunit G
METLRIILVWLLLAFGLFFFVGGVVGVIRLPDAYSRLHASGKVATMGLLGILMGVGVIVPSAAPKLLVLGLFISISAPVGSHAIAKADLTYTQLQQQGKRDSTVGGVADQSSVLDSSIESV